VASQSAERGNWLAAILLRVGIGFPLQFEQTSCGMPISTISQWQTPIATTNHRTIFQQEMQGSYQP
jgi:hypothetical protein